MKRKLPDLKRALRWIGLFVVIAMLGLYIVLPVGLGVAAVFPSKEAVGAPPDGFEAITLRTKDGVTLAGWYSHPPTARRLS